MTEKLESKFLEIKEQFNEYKKEGKYFDDYFNNVVRIVLGIPEIDYKKIGHESKLNNYQIF